MDWFKMAAFILLISLIGYAVGVEVKMTTLSSVYLPKYDQNNQETYKLLSYTLEQIAYDPKGQLVYGAGLEILHVINASDFTNLRAVHHVNLQNKDLDDIIVCGEHVFATYVNTNDARTGGLLVYKTYANQNIMMVRDISVNGQPDMVQATPDCRTLVLALQNEGEIIGGQFYDAPGGVAIVRFPSGVASQPEVKILDFTKFDDQFDELSKKGVRWVYRTSSNKFSDTVEPESIALSQDSTKAYVALQDNNAIAVVDLTTDTITAVHGLGFKQWGQLDPSDKDGGIRINDWPIYGMYQPDSLLTFRWNNDDYVITANEGVSVTYGAPVDFSEETRGAAFRDEDIASSVSSEVKQALKDESKLGRLKFSNVEGKNAEGKYEKFYAFGARGFSIWRISDMERVYDSGSDMERKTADLRPDIFNANVEVFDDTLVIADTRDTRSDDKGPETQTVLTTVLSDHAVIFATNERSSTIAVYTVEKGSMTPTFAALYADAIPKSNKTWFRLYEDREMFGIDPESICFVPARDGSKDKGVLLVGGAVTGTVTAVQVEITQSESDDAGNSATVYSLSVMVTLTCSFLLCMLTSFL